MHIALISFLTNSINTRFLSAYLKQNGYDVTCYFCSGTLNDSNLGELVRMLAEKNTTLVGVSLVTDDYHSAVVVTKSIQSELGLPVVWGGAHVNVKPEESLRHADMICLGEGEEALLECVKKMSESPVLDTSIRNIWFRTEAGIIRNELRPLEENLDKYPFPDFDLDSQYIMTKSGLDRVSEKHLNFEYNIMTSRGCPYSCFYCYNSYRRKQYSGKGKYLRARSIENVIEELSLARKMFKNLKEINFWDDSFVARRIEDFQLFGELYREKVNLPFFALIEPMAFNYAKIRLLRECGLSKLQIGIQSGSERVNREVYNRPVSNENVIEVAKTVHDMGIDVIYDLIFNNPYETKEDVYQTIRMLMQFPKPFILQGYNLIYYPGTVSTVNALKDGFISVKPDCDDFSTIQSREDSPLAMKGAGDVSSRFYSINYCSRDKEYLNSVIRLIAFYRVPRAVAKFFAASETPINKVMLRLLLQTYLAAFGLKQFLKKHLVRS